MTESDHEVQEIYIRSRGGNPEESFIDPEVSKTMTPEGRDLMRRVLGSTSLRIRVFDTNSLRKHIRDADE